ncbi:somatomedin-B and thrombospondin type-1 domain-containing protein isoform X2 [Oryzias latipes]|uniref:somatomedin-B and thrombospondin type-1 domain-containing protein isoform X2 n=1 Tax=Oryzias latipes TaxID=8090 RepID=UPI000CE16B18|nr:somatomedin-B and thrombospondin type-1 domain-containing protein isoform X2 [Oryzias latipes]
METRGWSSVHFGFVVCGYLAFFCAEFFPVAEAGCRERMSPNCCSGRNNDCYESSRRKTVCYCDTYCQKTGDCCEDYRGVCQISAIDCVVGSWGAWSLCTSKCGVGSTERSRQVSVPPRNGGAPCPDLRQRRGCYGNAAVCSAAKEVAKILPDSFKRNFKDPWRRPHMMIKEEKARVAGRPRDRVRSSFTCGELGGEPLHIERSQLRCSGTKSGCLLDASLGRRSGHITLGGGPRGDPGHTEETVSLGWPRNVSRALPQRSWGMGQGEGSLGSFA